MDAHEAIGKLLFQCLQGFLDQDLAIRRDYRDIFLVRLKITDVFHLDQLQAAANIGTNTLA